MSAGLSEERVREIVREELAVRLARPEKTVNVSESSVFTPEVIEQFQRGFSRRWEALGAGLDEERVRANTLGGGAA